MKKALSLLLAAAMCFSLAAAPQPAAAQEGGENTVVIAMISVDRWPG